MVVYKVCLVGITLLLFAWILDMPQIISVTQHSRFQLKTQFDKNVVTHFEVQEQVCDYIFSHLGIDSEGCVPHPIVMTEAFVAPNYCRQCKNIII